jgi:putative SOS response-associated peptidase YedK
MLTINAESHPIMNQFHKPADEKRMVVMLHDDQYPEWLNVQTSECSKYLVQYPTELLIAA